MNEYLGVPLDGHSWSTSYVGMYSKIVRDVLITGDVNAQLVMLASYGLDANMPPSNDALAMFLELGAGSKLQYWETHCHPGKQGPGPDAYISEPANYVLIGYSSWSYGQGYEAFDYPGGGAQADTTLTATLNNIVPE